MVYKKEGGKIYIALLGWFRKWGELWMLPKESVEEKDRNAKSAEESAKTAKTANAEDTKIAAKGAKEENTRDFESKQVLKKVALRALKEEMNIEREIEDYLGELQEKVTFEGVRKERYIHYFLIRYTQGDVKNSWEHDTAKWFEAEKVKSLRLKKGENEVVEKALVRLKN